MRKRMLSLLLSVVIVFSAFVALPIKANAGTVIESAISWAVDIANDNSHLYSQSVRWGPSYDCSSLVISAFKNAGVDTGSASWTGDMKSQFTQHGFTWIPWSQIGGVQNLVRGDVLLYHEASTGNGHTEIYIGNNQNVGAHSAKYAAADQISVSGYYYHPWDGVLRYNEDSYIDVGTDFYAYIINTDCWKPLINDGNHNACFNENADELKKIWHFIRKENGSYKIISKYDENVLDVDSSKSESGTDVGVWTDSNTSNQEWYIYGESAKYYFKPGCSDCVLDMQGGEYYDGVNAQIFTKNDTVAQYFQIWKLNKPGATCVHSAAGSNYIPTTIWWDATSDTKVYDIRIWKGSVSDGNLYKALWGVTDTSCLVDLPAGDYEAYVDSRNDYSITVSSNVTKFTVTEGTPVDLGDEFYAGLLINKNWLNVTNVDGNAELSSEAPLANKIWKFEKQSDGSYVIISCLDGKALDVYCAETKNGTNVQLCDINGNDAQKWYIYGRWSGEYYLKSKCADKVLDISGGNNNPGDNVQIWELNYTDAQKFAVYKVNPAGKSELSVVGGTSSNDTSFSWTASTDTDEYEVKIWKDNTTDGEAYKSYKTTEFNWNVILPAGNYKACVYSYNGFSSNISDTISFTVEKSILIGDVNNDSIVNIQDATEIQKYSAEMKTLSEDELTRADVNGDGTINVRDATLIQKYTVGLITEF